jgi:hypothetical protein
LNKTAIKDDTLPTTGSVRVGDNVQQNCAIIQHMITAASVVGSFTLDGGEVINNTRMRMVMTPVGDNKTTA